MSYKAKIDATQVAIRWLELQPKIIVNWEGYSPELKREYLQIVDDLKVTLRNYEYAQNKNAP